MRSLRHQGGAAVGTTVLMKLRRAATNVRRIYANSCMDNAAKPFVQEDAFFYVEFDRQARDYVRGMPMDDDKACVDLDQGGSGVRVSVLVTGIVDGELKLKAVQFFNEPKAAWPKPAGVDYGALEDMVLDGDDAKGKVVSFRGYHYEGKQWARVFGCSYPHYEGDGGIAVFIRPEDRTKAASVGASLRDCSTIRARLLEAPPKNADDGYGHPPDFNIELLSVAR
jgi:hypothetical protein